MKTGDTMFMVIKRSEQSFFGKSSIDENEIVFSTTMKTHRVGVKLKNSLRYGDINVWWVSNLIEIDAMKTFYLSSDSHQDTVKRSDFRHKKWKEKNSNIKALQCISKYLTWIHLVHPNQGESQKEEFIPIFLLTIFHPNT